MIDDRLMKIMPGFFLVSIVGLGTLSGVYTFSGIGLLIDKTSTAIILAIVIQVTIATTVLSFPFVTGFFPKTVVLSVYLVFLFISSGTAYVYIFNQQSSSGDIKDHDIKFISIVTDYVSSLEKSYDIQLNDLNKKMIEAKRLMEEEENVGGRSGQGDGKGKVFFQKEDDYERLKIKYEQEKRTYEKFLIEANKVRELIEKASSSQNYASSVIHIKRLSSFSKYTNRDLKTKVDDYISSLKSPVEKAIDPILRGEFKSISLITSIIWSTLFDIASFVIGFIWINRNRSKKSPFIDRFVNMVRGFHYGIIRIRNIGDEIKANNVIDHEGKKYEIDIARLYRFGARLVAISNAVTRENHSFQALDPLKSVVSHLKVLDFYSKDKDQDTPSKYIDVSDNLYPDGVVGILNSDIVNNKKLEPIIAMMLLEELFKIDHKYQAYVLNRENEVALDMVIYILNNPHMMENSQLREYYPNLVQERYETLPVKKAA